MANLITSCRILLSLLLLFFPALSPGFYGLYLAAGLSDMLDGFVARRTNSASPLGAKLDSMADIVFLAVCLIKLLPVLALPVWLWVWVGLIALLRLVNILSGFVCRKKLVLLHTRANKLTGALLFLLPLSLGFLNIAYTAVPLCALASFAAIQEGHFIRTGREIS
ncbi:MAG: CDP-alcohol phosphatidyltransferase family protein [Candidatus Limivicinus sp.]|nr:CDP-alcohol phosphatidyltransferase family protein [Candidatus Limivicinus sp.]